ncbi:hypothetical protein NIES4071_58110 [Calothrix sp. NIES-4071]|nr:hypothetical protein NIES4071_58110 [Calothrix sp. NIES-4071]BAZ60118.1 hypothetical protein NIES4105_58060 [Calothrix sp. NIES-4105]
MAVIYYRKPCLTIFDYAKSNYNHYPYPIEIQEAINNTIETCTFELGALESYKQNRHLQTVGVS